MLYEETEGTGLSMVKKTSLTTKNYGISSSRMPSQKSIKLQEPCLSLGTITLSHEEIMAAPKVPGGKKGSVPPQGNVKYESQMNHQETENQRQLIREIIDKRDTIKDMQSKSNKNSALKNLNSIATQFQKIQNCVINQSLQKNGNGLQKNAVVEYPSSYNSNYLQPLKGGGPAVVGPTESGIGQFEGSPILIQQRRQPDGIPSTNRGKKNYSQQHNRYKYKIDGLPNEIDQGLANAIANGHFSGTRNSSMINTTDGRMHHDVRNNFVQGKKTDENNTGSMRNDQIIIKKQKAHQQQQSSVPVHGQMRKTLASMTVNVNTLPLQRNQYITKNMENLAHKKLMLGSRLAVNPPEIKINCKKDQFPIQVPVRNVETANFVIKSPRNQIVVRNALNQSEVANIQKIETLENTDNVNSPKQINSNNVKVVFSDQTKQFGTIDGIKIKVRQIKQDQQEQTQFIPELINQQADGKKIDSAGLSKLKLAQKYKQQAQMQATTERIELRELGQQVMMNTKFMPQAGQGNGSHINNIVYPIMNTQPQAPNKMQEKISIRAYKRSFANILGLQNLQKQMHHQGQPSNLTQIPEKLGQTASNLKNNSFYGKMSPHTNDRKRLTQGSKFFDQGKQLAVDETGSQKNQDLKAEQLSQVDFSTFNLISIQKDRGKKQQSQQLDEQALKIKRTKHDKNIENNSMDKKLLQDQLYERYCVTDGNNINSLKQSEFHQGQYERQNAEQLHQSLKTFNHEFPGQKYRYPEREIDQGANEHKQKWTVSQQSGHRASSNNMQSQLDNLSKNYDYQADFYKMMNISQKNFMKSNHKKIGSQPQKNIDHEIQKIEMYNFMDKSIYANGELDANSNYLLNNTSHVDKKVMALYQKQKRGKKNMEILCRESSLMKNHQSVIDQNGRVQYQMSQLIQNDQDSAGKHLYKTHHQFGVEQGARHLSAELPANSDQKHYTNWKDFEDNILSKEVQLDTKQNFIRHVKPESNSISISTTQTSKKKTTQNQIDDSIHHKLIQSNLEKYNTKTGQQNSTEELSPMKTAKKFQPNQTQFNVKQPIYLCCQTNVFGRNSMKSFNECISVLNQLMALTVRSKSTIVGSNETYHKIQKLAKSCGLPQEFIKKNNVDMNSFIKTKDFLVLMRVRTHQLINQVVRQQFQFGGTAGSNTSPPKNSTSGNFESSPLRPQTLTKTSSNAHKPVILRIGADEFQGGSLKVDLGSYASKNLVNQATSGSQPGNNTTNPQQKLVSFKFFTDQTGNNHPVVRQVLKRRTWLQLFENIKAPQGFEQISLFWTQWKKQSIIEKLSDAQIYAKIEGNGLITNKAELLQTMIFFFHDRYKKTKKGPKDPFHLLPLTFNVKSSRRMESNNEFNDMCTKIRCQSRSDSQQIWICKPGENANRGNGIVVLPSLEQVQRFLQQTKSDEPWVIQKYINHPLLIGGRFWHESPMRKFDIRMFALAQIVDGIHYRGYFYKEGYIRTSSFEYDIDDLSDRDIHLTNDAVQQDCREYGKYEQGNKISFKDFATYLQNYKKVDFYKEIYPKMREAIKSTLEALWARLQAVEPHENICKDQIKNQFELLGYDFMIDNQMNVYLIEVNTNPCLDTSPCPLLQRLITQVLDQTFKLAVDPFLQGRDIQYAQAHEMSLTELQYEMIVSNQPEVSQKLMNEPKQLQHVPSSKFLNVSPHKIPEFDQAENIIKAPTTPVSPLNLKKGSVSKKSKQIKKNMSKENSHSIHSNLQLNSNKRNNTLSRASSQDPADDKDISQRSQRVGATSKIMAFTDFTLPKREASQSNAHHDNYNSSNTMKNKLLEIHPIKEIKDIYSQNVNANQNDLLAGKHHGKNGETKQKQQSIATVTIGAQVKSKTQKAGGTIAIKKKLGKQAKH